jgi:hypothetical protein
MSRIGTGVYLGYHGNLSCIKVYSVFTNVRVCACACVCVCVCVLCVCVCRFTQNLSIFRRDINDSLRSQPSANSTVNIVILNDMM